MENTIPIEKLILSDLETRISRYRAFFASREPGKLLVIANPSPKYASAEEPAELTEGDNLPVALSAQDRAFQAEWTTFTLSDFDLADNADNRRYLDHQVLQTARRLLKRHGLRDDYIPCCDIYYGVALDAACVSNAPLRFTAGTSWIDPCIDDWDDLSKLRLDPDNFWLKRRLDAAAYLKQKFGGWCFVAVSHLGPMDLALLLRGNQLFLDFQENPKRVHELMDFCTRGLIWAGDLLRDTIGDIYGGATAWGFEGQGIWLPSLSGYCSEDTPLLCLPDVYLEFGLPYMQRLADHCGGYGIHTHALGRKQFSALAKVRGLHLLEMQLDPNAPRPVDDIDAIYREVDGVPLLVHCTADDVFRRIEVLKQGQAILDVSVDSPEEAQRVIDVVRQVSRV